MLFRILKKINAILLVKYCTQSTALTLRKIFKYDMPDYYNKSFYLANASLADNTNWFVHNALTVVYDDLISELIVKGHKSTEAVKLIDDILCILLPYNYVLDTNFSVKLGGGGYKTFRGFRAQHGLCAYNDIPSLGGFRLSSDISENDIQALAAITTYKHACVGIDMPGAHGGILLQTQGITENDLQKVIESFAKELSRRGFCGDNIDIFEPDMQCRSEEIKAIIAGYLKISERKNNVCAVGKPVAFGGVKNYELAVGQGILFGLNMFLNNEDITRKLEMETGLANKTFILQGLGKAGGITATYLASAGMKCTSIVDHDCNITDKEGINIKEATAYKEKNNTLQDYRNMTKTIPQKFVLKETCDVLLIAAGQSCLPYYVSDIANAKILVEVANGPISPLSHKTLVGRKKLILPDIYINCGSSIASYYEYLLNMQHVQDTSNTVHFAEKLSTLKKVKEQNPSEHQQAILKLIGKDDLSELIGGTMQKVYKELIATAEKYDLGLDFRTAGYVNVIRKLFWEVYKNSY